MTSVRQGNDRSANIARWIGAQSFRTRKPDRLVLYCWVGDEARDVVITYAIEDVIERLAPKLSELIDDYANDAGQHCKARLEYRDDGPDEIAGKNFRGQCESANVLGQSMTYDGTLNSQLQQNQKHLEACMMLHKDMVGRTGDLVRIVMERDDFVLRNVDPLLKHLTVNRDAELERLRVQLDEMIAKNTELESLSTQAMDTAESIAKQAEEAQGAGEDRMGTLIQMISAKASSPAEKPG